MRNILRFTARATLLVFTSLVFIFALLSGAEQYGGGLMGIVRNSPNALPWLLLFGLSYVAWRWELVGGILIIIFGVAGIFFFNLIEQGWLPLLIIGVSPIVLGGFFLTAHFLDKNKSSVIK